MARMLDAKACKCLIICLQEADKPKPRCGVKLPESIVPGPVRTPWSGATGICIGADFSNLSDAAGWPANFTLLKGQY
jgi:hypothetical protein